MRWGLIFSFCFGLSFMVITSVGNVRCNYGDSIDDNAYENSDSIEISNDGDDNDSYND